MCFNSSSSITHSFFKWAIPGLFFCIFRLFWIAIDSYVQDNLLPMSGFELRISSAGSDRSANCATTTAFITHSYNIGASKPDGPVFHCFALYSIGR